MKKIKVAVIGPGNIGSDLMYKILRSEHLEMAMMAGIVESEGIKRAKSLGIQTTTDGVNGVLKEKDIQIVFDATSAAAHLKHAPLLKEAGKIAVDLTPAAVGPYMVPSVNLEKLMEKDSQNINLVTCGGQATIPIVYAVSRVAGAKYAEIVACISSMSAGPGTRANIDEFTETTAKAIEKVGGADKGKAIIILNPAEPPIMMTNTIYVKIKDTSVSLEEISASINEIVEEIQQYVPGYKLRVPPILDGDKVTVGVEVEGQGDFLPTYSGNLDIINAAAIRAAEQIAQKLEKEES
ncbi:acetaldehyde dehydrogenase (acetylating) [Breznakia sp. PF5-3]|nr:MULTISPECIES: acetaldehyde dehydrogenase (acetylating) [unclassified Breznakia]MDF9825037.1 acetaldehyde dehydrogenase (acetylating) [Breznakia sp. PM6-1]MDF9835884.1 acetaldehyde dehydrogenase (acetylating) [Breznakia sp. PF5-3]MDF9837345.1 acetaldehyde dehydrogenase (acetylating) [Breznakia sp. PFB2-8]MDF9859280.1 acetaldehyde dehydrogenase (acetylating) [Breznakia sp. PH5-24]